MSSQTGLNIRFPIRFKLLVTLLVVITVVVGAITYTMAKLFHTDKTTYVYDLTSVMAQHMAEEAHSLQVGYQKRLRLFARIMFDPGLPQAEKSKLLSELFKDIDDFVAVSLYENNKEKVTIFDAKSFESIGLKKEDVLGHGEGDSLPFDEILRGKMHFSNSTRDERLPIFTISVGLSGEEFDRPVVASAVVRLEKLLDLVNRNSEFESYIIGSDGYVLAHNDISKVLNRSAVDWIPLESLRRIVPLVEKQSTATTLEYQADDGNEIISGFARAQSGSMIVGVQIPKSAAFLTARELLDNLVWVSFILLIVAAVIGLIWAQRLTRPLERLSVATKELGKGDFKVHLDIGTHDEIGALAGSFNRMAVELDDREQALKNAQSALIQSEKMAAFGQLGAGIAHEVKNPLAGILGYAQLSMRKVDQDSPVYRNLAVIEKETKRCKTIIENLMKFARHETGDMRLSDLNQIVEDAVAIVDHQLSINQVTLIRDLAQDLPKIMADANQLQQVLLNFFINAQQAMDGNPGEVRVSTRLTEDGRVEVCVKDTGPGMSPEIQAKIFEPFFTTKPAGKGTGLGLSVTYGIIRDHKGVVRIESEVGKGAAFFVTFPVGTDESAVNADVTPKVTVKDY